jgi:hypothetical protein
MRALLSAHVFCFIALCFSATGCDNTSGEDNHANSRATEVVQGILPALVTPQPDTPQLVRSQRDGADFLGQLTAIHDRGFSVHLLNKDNPTVLLLDIASAQMEPVLVANPGQGLSALDALTSKQFDIVVGSGFVTELHSLQPVGLLQVNGNTLSPTQTHGYTRILGINDKGMGVVHKNAYQRDLFHSALQAGPGIIEEGQLDISERDLQRPKYFRSFVAVCEDRWLAGISLTPRHLRTLGAQLLEFFTAQNWHCKDVVNLAGDRQAVLLVSLGDGRTAYHGDPNTHKVSLLGFRSR